MLIYLTVIVSVSVTAQITTSEMAGRATDRQASRCRGVIIEAVHVPTGTSIFGRYK